MIQVETKNVFDLYDELEKIPLFAYTKKEDLGCLGEISLLTADPGANIMPALEEKYFWILLEGEIRVEKQEKEGQRIHIVTYREGESFGEVPLLVGRTVATHILAAKPSRVIRIGEPEFWLLMAQCPSVRKGVLVNMAQRLQQYQAQAWHREKLVSLGTLAAGLMHELNNPGAAAKRAASQMRENLVRLQELSLRFCDIQLSPEQLTCMRALQEHALQFHRPNPMSTLEQADAEEALADWLSSAGIPDAWKMAPSLQMIGLTPRELSCAASTFSGELMADALGWLNSLVSSMQLVGTIEESVTRVSELVMAVKKYAHEDKSTCKEVDVHDSIESTLMILGHKFRQKSLTVNKQFDAPSARIQTRGTGLSQVWTNILDNAIDASPSGGTVKVRTWQENSGLVVAISDNGPGIPVDCQPRIFEPFFTTKGIGEGTGLGLGIVHRIVVENFQGSVDFDSREGHTEFRIKLPFSDRSGEACETKETKAQL